MSDKTAVAERGNRVSSQGHPGRGFTRGASKKEISGKPSKIYREQMGERVMETGEIQVDREPHVREGLEIFRQEVRYRLK